MDRVKAELTCLEPAGWAVSFDVAWRLYSQESIRCVFGMASHARFRGGAHVDLNERSEWANCPHCRAYGEQVSLLALDPRTEVRWSTCKRCGQTAIWDGDVTVFPVRDQQRAC